MDQLLRLPRWTSAVGLALLLAACWALVYATGGTRTALPHAFYLPIVLAALPFGIKGGLIAGLAATLLCGPFLPLDVASGEAQSAVNWLARGAFFLAVGGMAGSIRLRLQDRYTEQLTDRLRQDLDEAYHSARDEDFETVARVRRMLTERAFSPVFQPIYALDDGRLVAVEALTRFHSEPYQPPDHWFDEAAAAGLGVELELAAVDAALSCAEGLLADGVAVSVNTSPQALADPRLLRLLDAHPELRVIVEVTEHAVVDDYDLLVGVREQLRDRGVRLAVDDAGAGFASLRHIVRLAPEIIKLDMSLTRHVRADPVRLALATSLTRFAHEVGSDLVAEGIEHTSDLVAWRQLGAHCAQGFLLAKPGPLPAPAMFPLPARTLLRQAG